MSITEYEEGTRLVCHIQARGAISSTVANTGSHLVSSLRRPAIASDRSGRRDGSGRLRASSRG